MFKTAAEINEIVQDAKAYLYESTQTIGEVYQKYPDNVYFNRLMNYNAQGSYFIKAIEFIGSNIEQNNLFVEALQGVTQRAIIADSYVEMGYVDDEYTKPNKI